MLLIVYFKGKGCQSVTKGGHLKVLPFQLKSLYTVYTGTAAQMCVCLCMCVCVSVYVHVCVCACTVLLVLRPLQGEPPN